MLPVFSAGSFRRLIASTGLYDLSEGTMVSAELAAMQTALDILTGEINALQNDAFPQLCSQERLREWELLLGIPLRPAATAAARRAEISARLGITPRDFTRAGMLRTLAAIGIQAALAEDPSTDSLTVTVEAFTNPAAGIYDLLSAAAALMPAHLSVVFLYGGPDWSAWEALHTSWTAFDSGVHSWEQLDSLNI